VEAYFGIKLAHQESKLTLLQKHQPSKQTFVQDIGYSIDAVFTNTGVTG
jgi:hypothetical protein